MDNGETAELVLNESVIHRSEISGCEVSLIFSIAHLHFFNDKKEWLPNKSEFKKARITIDEATGRIPCEGTILDGHFILNGQKYMNIPLPGPFEGNLELHLVMDCGEFTFKFKKVRITLLSKT